jgi:hypothetical protein
MNLQDIASSLMQPSDNDNVVADHEAVKAFRQQRANFKPSVGRTLRTLFGRFAAILDAGPDHTNGTKLCRFVAMPVSSHLSSRFLLGRHRRLLQS